MKTCGRVLVLQNEKNEVVSCYQNLKELKTDCVRSYDKCDFSRLDEGIIICDNREFIYSIKEVIG